MMEKFDKTKLIYSIELILFKSLKENSDDSYSHKLIDLVEYIKPKLSLDDLQNLTSIVGNALSHETAVTDIDLSTAFKLIGTIVSDERIITEKPETVTTGFDWIVNFSYLLQDEEKPYYDLQYSFLKCVDKLCATDSGCQYLALKEDLLLIIFHLLTKSQGFYVQIEAQSVITTLLANVLTKPDFSKKLQPYLHQMLLVNCKSHMECLNNLVKKDDMRQFLISIFKLDEILLSKLKLSIKNDNLLSLFCEILGVCGPSRECIDQVTQTLLEANKLKAIMSFYTALFKTHGHGCLNEWKLFTIYPFVKTNEELNNQIIGVQSVKQLISEKETSALLMSALRYIDEEIVDLLSADDRLFLLLCIGNFIQGANHTPTPKKIVSESLNTLNLLWKSSDCLSMVHKSLEIFLQLITDSFIESSSLKHIKFDILKNIREIIQQHKHILSQQIFVEICAKLNDILTVASSDADFDLVDSALEIMIVILNSNGESFLNYYPVLIENFLNYWDLTYQTSNESSLISSCIPVLLCVGLFHSRSQINKCRILENNSINQILNNYLIEGEYFLRDAVIKAIDYNFLSLIASNSWDNEFSSMFTKFYGLPMCQLVLSEIDSEVLSNILRIWMSICETLSLKQDKESKSNIIQMLYESGFFTSLWLLLKDELITGTIKTLVFNTAHEVFKLLNKNEITESELCSIFNTSKEPEFSITVEDISEKYDQVHRNREQVIDDIFKENSTLPTQDLINVVTSELKGAKKLTRRKRDIGNVRTDMIAQFFTSPIETLEIIDELSDAKFAILDDIISARNFDTKIPSDCY